MRWVHKHPRHAKMVRLVEYLYLIIRTIHALECTRTRHFYVKKSKMFWGGAPDPDPGGGASNSLAPALAVRKIEQQSVARNEVSYRVKYPTSATATIDLT